MSDNGGSSRVWLILASGLAIVLFVISAAGTLTGIAFVWFPMYPVFLAFFAIPWLLLRMANRDSRLARITLGLSLAAAAMPLAGSLGIYLVDWILEGRRSIQVIYAYPFAAIALVLGAYGPFWFSRRRPGASEELAPSSKAKRERAVDEGS